MSHMLLWEPYPQYLAISPAYGKLSNIELNDIRNALEFKLKTFLHKTLLRHGANPDLRDEDGKTPLDKARERGHSEVVAILQSPGELCVLS